MAESSSAKVDWSLAKGLGYVLDDRSHAAACRLNLQHYLWKDALEFNLHPSISFGEDFVVADVAAGTGAWLIDIARQFPNAKLEGFDIDLDQAPHENWLPSNVKIRYWNIFEDVPSDLIEKYDVVHVRLLVLVIEPGNHGVVIRNLLKLLKPGGYLQWDELDCVNMCVKQADPTNPVPAPALEQLREMSYANGRYNWTLKLPEFLMGEGFQDAKIDYFGDHKDLVRAFNEQHLFTMELFALTLVKAGKKEAAEKFFQIIREGYQESTKGAALCIPRTVCVARKPIS